MSGFKRTTSGLNNQHIFHNVDFVVFVEGGTSYNKEEVYQGKYTDESEDVIFWRSVFKKFRSGKKIKFKSVGSKTTLKEIAIDVVDGKLTTVFVAMDNEFDELLNKRLPHPNVFYTHGYSWENDIWSSTVIKAVIQELSAVEIEGNDIETCFNDFLAKIKIAVFADAYLFKQNTSFFPRKSGYMFCVDCRPIDLPEIKIDIIENKIIEKGITLRKAKLFGNKHSIDTLKFCFGHFLADYCCQIVLNYLKNRHSLTNLSKDFIYRLGIKKHFELIFDTGITYTHYKQQFDKNGC